MHWALPFRCNPTHTSIHFIHTHTHTQMKRTREGVLHLLKRPPGDAWEEPRRGAPAPARWMTRPAPCAFYLIGVFFRGCGGGAAIHSHGNPKTFLKKYKTTNKFKNRKKKTKQTHRPLGRWRPRRRSGGTRARRPRGPPLFYLYYIFMCILLVNHPKRPSISPYPPHPPTPKPAPTPTNPTHPPWQNTPNRASSSTFARASSGSCVRMAVRIRSRLRAR